MDIQKLIRIFKTQKPEDIELAISIELSNLEDIVHVEFVHLTLVRLRKWSLDVIIHEVQFIPILAKFKQSILDAISNVQYRKWTDMIDDLSSVSLLFKSFRIEMIVKLSSCWEQVDLIKKFHIISAITKLNSLGSETSQIGIICQLIKNFTENCQLLNMSKSAVEKMLEDFNEVGELEVSPILAAIIKAQDLEIILSLSQATTTPKWHTKLCERGPLNISIEELLEILSNERELDCELKLLAISSSAISLCSRLRLVNENDFCELITQTLFNMFCEEKHHQLVDFLQFLSNLSDEQVDGFDEIYAFVAFNAKPLLMNEKLEPFEQLSLLLSLSKLLQSAGSQYSADALIYGESLFQLIYELEPNVYSRMVICDVLVAIFSVVQSVPTSWFRQLLDWIIWMFDGGVVQCSKFDMAVQIFAKTAPQNLVDELLEFLYPKLPSRNVFDLMSAVKLCTQLICLSIPPVALKQKIVNGFEEILMEMQLLPPVVKMEVASTLLMLTRGNKVAVESLKNSLQEDRWSDIWPIGYEQLLRLAIVKTARDEIILKISSLLITKDNMVAAVEHQFIGGHQQIQFTLLLQLSIPKTKIYRLIIRGCSSDYAHEFLADASDWILNELLKERTASPLVLQAATMLIISNFGSSLFSEFMEKIQFVGQLEWIEIICQAILICCQNCPPDLLATTSLRIRKDLKMICMHGINGGQYTKELFCKVFSENVNL